MSNNLNNTSNPSQPDKWQIDEFLIRKISVEFIDVLREGYLLDDPLQSDCNEKEHLSADDLISYKQKYPLHYEVEPFYTDDTISVILSVQVNTQPQFPGYRIECVAQTDYTLANEIGKEITEIMITPRDMEFFLLDTHDTMQDHILTLTEVMALGAYILPPPNLEGSIGKEIDGLINPL